MAIDGQLLQGDNAAAPRAWGIGDARHVHLGIAEEESQRVEIDSRGRETAQGDDLTAEIWRQHNRPGEELSAIVDDELVDRGRAGDGIRAADHARRVDGAGNAILAFVDDAHPGGTTHEQIAAAAANDGVVAAAAQDGTAMAAAFQPVRTGIAGDHVAPGRAADHILDVEDAASAGGRMRRQVDLDRRGVELVIQQVVHPSRTVNDAAVQIGLIAEDELVGAGAAREVGLGAERGGGNLEGVGRGLGIA